MMLLGLEISKTNKFSYCLYNNSSSTHESLKEDRSYGEIGKVDRVHPIFQSL